MPLLLLLLSMNRMGTAEMWPWCQVRVGRQPTRHMAACQAVLHPWLPTHSAASLATSAPSIMRRHRYTPGLVAIGVQGRSAAREC